MPPREEWGALPVWLPAIKGIYVGCLQHADHATAVGYNANGTCWGIGYSVHTPYTIYTPYTLLGVDCFRRFRA